MPSTRLPGGKNREPADGRAKSASSKKIAPSLVALSSAAVLAIYSAGFLRTRAAAAQFATTSAQRRAAGPREAGLPARLASVPSATSVPVAASPASSAAPPPASAGAPAVAVAGSDSTVSKTGAGDVRPAAESAPVSGPSSSPAAAVAAEPQPAPSPEIQAPAPMARLDATELGLATTEIPVAPPAPGTVKNSFFKDGTYYGWGTSRHGDINAEVVIAGGVITRAAISDCNTRYPCSWIATLPPQVIARQDYKVDIISGATESAIAYSDAVAAALVEAHSAKSR